MNEEIYKTIELTKDELLSTQGGSLSEAADAIWNAIGFMFTLNSRKMYKDSHYLENFYNH